MKTFNVAVFSSKSYDQQSLLAQRPESLSMTFFDVRLTEQSVQLAQGFDAVCAFVNDELNDKVLSKLTELI